VAGFLILCGNEMGWRSIALCVAVPLADGESVIKYKSPLSVRKYTHDHSFY
jgi:hypothetical protein